MKISDGFDKACDVSIANLEKICETIDVQVNDHEFLVQAAMTALGSKVVSKYKRELAKIAVSAALSVTDF